MAKKQKQTSNKAALWTQIPQAAKDVIEDIYCDFSQRGKDISDSFVPTAPWFSISSWGTGMMLASHNTQNEVTDLILDKLSRNDDEGFDLWICDSTGETYEWDISVVLKKVQ